MVSNATFAARQAYHADPVSFVNGIAIEVVDRVARAAIVLGTEIDDASFDRAAAEVRAVAHRRLAVRLDARLALPEGTEFGAVAWALDNA